MCVTEELQCPCAPKKRSIGKFLAITNNLQVHKVMSSECWVEPCSEGQAQGTGLEKQQGEEVKKEEVEVPCGDNQPVGSLRQEEPGRERPSSPDLEQVQRVETQTQEKRERFSHESRDRGSGLWRLKWDIKCDVFCCLCCLYCSITKYNTSHYNAVKKKKAIHFHSLIVFGADGITSQSCCNPLIFLAVHPYKFINTIECTHDRT